MLITYFNQKFAVEYQQISLWYFVSFIAGILLFFTNQFTNYFYLTLLFLLIFTNYLSFSSHNSLIVYFCNYCLLFFLVGLLSSHIRCYVNQVNSLKQVTIAKVTGRVLSTKPILSGQQVVLLVKQTNMVEKISKIQLNIAPKFAHNLSIGQTITFKAKLFPLQTSILPGSYDFSFFLKLQSIAATGYALTKPAIIATSQDHFFSSSKFDFFKKYREQIYQRLISVLGNREGNFVAAILIGQTKALPVDIAKNMRDSGIAHLLSVSGLHLSLVAMFFFFTSRFLLNISNFLAYCINIRQISAIIALIASFVYLQLSGNNIAAIRAFIMTSIFIIAIIFNRDLHPIRSVLVAGFIMLCYAPEYIFHPSFQLSFLAVLSLIAGYELYIYLIFSPVTGFFSKIKAYLFSNIFTSFLASLVTAPLLLYHFYQFPNYSVIMNFIAVPLMCFFIMPLALLALITMPLNIDQFFLYPLGKLISWLTTLAGSLAKWPHAITYWGYIPGYSLLIFTFGIFWLAFWQTRWRFLGLIFILTAMMIIWGQKKPFFLYDHRLKAAAIKNNYDLTIYAQHPLGQFITNYWQNWFGAQNSNYHITPFTKEDIFLNLKKDISISFNYHTCQQADIMLILSKKLTCNITEFNKSQLITASELDATGKLLIFYSGSNKKNNKNYSIELH